jgi:hypothetical protein
MRHASAAPPLSLANAKEAPEKRVLAFPQFSRSIRGRRRKCLYRKRFHDSGVAWLTDAIR